MRGHVIVGRYGPSDRSRVPLGAGEHATNLDLVAGDQTLGYGIGRAILDMVDLKVGPTEVGVDLLVLAAHVHAADTRLARTTESQDGWTREIRLAVPVAEPERWTAAASIFVRLLNFLTGDRWALTFRARVRRFASVVPTEATSLPIPRFDDLALFSGGLDSLIGAIDVLECGRTPLFISHAGDGAASSAQATLFAGLKAHYRGRAFDRLRLWMAFPRGFVSGSNGENTTRGRSFLFFALGAFAGSGMAGRVTLRVPENGLIAINVPLDPLRLGALSTRTTHPFYIARWKDALRTLGMNVGIENGYWDKTKGEMVRNCANGEVLRRLTAAALSCSSPVKGRWQGVGVQHCGYCLPCVIRRAALLTGFGPHQDPTIYTVETRGGRTVSASRPEGREIRSLQIALERLHANPAVAAILVHKPGPLLDESPARRAALAAVYRRGLEEVGELLAGVRTRSG